MPTTITHARDYLERARAILLHDERAARAHESINRAIDALNQIEASKSGMTRVHNNVVRFYSQATKVQGKDKPKQHNQGPR